MADGSITFRTDLDNKQLEKDLNALQKQIKDTEKEQANGAQAYNAAVKERNKLYDVLLKKQEKLAELQGKQTALEETQAPLIAEAERLKQEMTDAKAKVEEYKQAWLSGVSGADKQQSETQQKVHELRNAYNKALAEAEKLDPAILKANAAVEKQAEVVKEAERQWSNAKHEARNAAMENDNIAKALKAAKEEAGKLVAILTDVADQSKKVAKETDKSESAIARFEKRIIGLAKRVFVFSLITTALRSVRSWFGEMIKANSDATAAIARLKGALLTLAQPLVQVVIPAFVSLVNILTRVVTVVAQLVATLFGTTLKSASESAKAMHDEKKAISGVGSAAKKSAGQLAAFDEVNQLSDSNAGGGADSTITPDFNLGEEMNPSRLKEILGIIELIGAALAGWKLGNALGLDLVKTFGLIMAIYGAIQFVKQILDMWNNGVTLDNLLKALEALLMVAAGLGLAFGQTAAGVALIVGGLALLAAGFKDAMENGMTLENTLTMIAGLLAAGLGLSIITGSLIPLFIAAILSAVLALAYFTGNGEALMEGLCDIFDGFIEFITGAFAGDWEKAFAGLEKMGGGFKKTWEAIVKSIKDAWASFVKWFDEKTNGKFHYALVSIEKWFNGTFGSVKTILSGVIDFVAGVFTGDWDRAWKGIKNIFIGIWNGIVTALEAAINFLISGINTAQQGIIRALNNLLTLPDWVPVIGGKSLNLRANIIQPISLPRVPALAQGAVIPPNREFLAVLGDQRNGNNIEAPEALLRQMAQEAAGVNTALLREILQAIREGKVIMVDKQVLGKTARSAMRGLDICGY